MLRSFRAQKDESPMTKWMVILLAGSLSAAEPVRVVVRPGDNGTALVNPGMGWVFHHYDNGLRNYGANLAPADTVDEFPGASTVIAPDYDDPIFLEKLEHFLAAAGARYDGNPELAFIDVGTLGAWGEGHTVPSTRRPYAAPTAIRQIDLAGNRDSVALAQLCHPRVKSSQDTVAKARRAPIARSRLRPKVVARKAPRHFQLAGCQKANQEIESRLQGLETSPAAAAKPPARTKKVAVPTPTL